MHKIKKNNTYTQILKKKIIYKFYIELLFLLLKLGNLINIIRKIMKNNMSRNMMISSIGTIVLLWCCFAIHDYDKYTILETIIAIAFDPLIIVLSVISIIKEKYYQKVKNYLLISTFALGFYSLFWGFVCLSSRKEYNDLIFSSSEFISFFSFFTGIFLCWGTFKLKYEDK
mgnify:CR=1 FL=1|tara:strand:+ start:9790 stop:10302 length:513 start_codon:yes stop_codon:yes gene_type:complete